MNVTQSIGPNCLRSSDKTNVIPNAPAATRPFRRPARPVLPRSRVEPRHGSSTWTQHIIARRFDIWSEVDPRRVACVVMVCAFAMMPRTRLRECFKNFFSSNRGQTLSVLASTSKRSGQITITTKVFFARQAKTVAFGFVATSRWRLVELRCSSTAKRISPRFTLAILGRVQLRLRASLTLRRAVAANHPLSKGRANAPASCPYSCARITRSSMGPYRPNLRFSGTSTPPNPIAAISSTSLASMRLPASRSGRGML